MNLYQALRRPALYEPSPSIWTDEHITKGMLLAHLDESNDAASYTPARRARICAFLQQQFGLDANSLLDLGCGPGLYAEWFARTGMQVTGVDFAGNSIAYARESAQKANLDIRYILQDYRQPLATGTFDACMMISQDYGVMSPADRAQVLTHVYTALRSGGVFALDVMSDMVWDRLEEKNRWHRSEAGFWRPHPHVVIEKTYLYSQERAFCDVCLVCDDDVSVYYTHQTFFTPERITYELTAAGFATVGIYENLEGKTADTEYKGIGVIARK